MCIATAGTDAAPPGNAVPPAALSLEGMKPPQWAIDVMERTRCYAFAGDADFGCGGEGSGRTSFPAGATNTQTGCEGYLAAFSRNQQDNRPADAEPTDGEMDYGYVVCNAEDPGDGRAGKCAVRKSEYYHSDSGAWKPYADPDAPSPGVAPDTGWQPFGDGRCGPSRVPTEIKPKPDPKTGRTEVEVFLPGPGRLTATSEGAKTATAITAKSGYANVVLKARGKVLRKLKRSGRAKATVRFGFAPTGWLSGDATAKVNFALKRRG